MYKFWYDFIKPRYEDRAKLCYMDTDSLVIHIETDDFSKGIADDDEKWLDTSNYNEDGKRLLPIGKNKKIPDLFKDELNGNIMKEFFSNRAETYTYSIDDDTEHKKAKEEQRNV